MAQTFRYVGIFMIFGYSVARDLLRLTLAQKTIDNFIEKALRLYEQEPPCRKMKRLGEYVMRWFIVLVVQRLTTSGP